MTATSTTIVARPRSEQLRLTDVPVHDLARAAMHDATSGVMPILKRENRHYWRLVHQRLDLETRLGAVGEDLIILANAGQHEAALRGVELFVRDIIDRCFAGRARREILTIDLDEQLVDGLEDVLTIERRNATEQGRALAPEKLEEEAAVNTRLASLLIERARALRALAGSRRAAPPAERPRPITRVLRADAIGA